MRIPCSAMIVSATCTHPDELWRQVVGWQGQGSGQDLYQEAAQHPPPVGGQHDKVVTTALVRGCCVQRLPLGCIINALHYSLAVTSCDMVCTLPLPATLWLRVWMGIDNMACKLWQPAALLMVYSDAYYESGTP